MTVLKKKKSTTKTTKPAKKTSISNTTNKSIYSKQNIKKKLNEFGDNDAL
ncbi:hypothetical protein BC748_0535 [Flavobacterium dankookense]|uniref:Uncharacterized protein n=1 Tax=Flavobacterium dankookense TaxID=706186 RepID=A0A4R6QG50_9FLAO|nr:hypothetical protein BC748_0535 [Flavobacterium dankookense]